MLPGDGWLTAAATEAAAGPYRETRTSLDNVVTFPTSCSATTA